MMKAGFRLQFCCLAALCLANTLTAAPAKPGTPAPPKAPAKKVQRRPPAAPRWTPRYGSWGVTIDPAGKEFPLILEEIQRARELGVSMVRFVFNWATCVPTPNRYQNQRFDAALHVADRQQLKAVGVFGGTRPAYVKTPGAVMPGAKDFDAALYDGFLAYVENVVRANKRRIRCWELLDRIDPAFTPAQYAKLAADMIAVIRKVDASAKLLPPPATPATLPHLKAILACGTGKHFDAVNAALPVASTDPELSGNVLTAGAANRLPVWVTRVGHPGGAVVYPYRYLVQELCRASGFGPGAAELLLLADDQKNRYTEQFNFRRSSLGRFGKVTEIPCSRIPQLDPAQRQILVLPPHAMLAKADADAVVAYVKRGGRVLVPHDNDDFFTPARLEQLHLSLENAGSYDRLGCGPSVPDLPQLPVWKTPVTFRGITPYRLRPGDRYRVLVQLSSGKITATAAAIVSYGSDLKGRLLWVRGCVDGFGGSCTEEQQAKRLPRDLIFCRARGAVKVFYDRLTALEESGAADQHFGLLTRNLENKLAYSAYQTLIRMMPDGSSRPAVSSLGKGVWLATWQQPDKSTVYALWVRLGVRRVKLQLPPGGQVREAYYFTGQRFGLNPANLLISEAVVYFKAPAGVKVTVI